MHHSIWNKKIPTLLGLLITLIGIITTSALVKTGVIFVGKATPTENPENIRISNISDTSFTVSYTTQAKVIGSLSYGKDKNLTTSISDDRDQQKGTVSSYNIHYFTLRDLDPNSSYSFSILSGQTTFLNNSTNEPFSVVTGPSITTPPQAQEPLGGKIINPDGTPPQESIVLLSGNGTQTISTLVKEDGSYVLPLNSIREKNLSAYALLTQGTLFKMLVVGIDKQSNVLLSTKDISPVPIVTLSNDYDFRTNPSLVAQEASLSAEPLLGFPEFTAGPVTKDPVILIPKDNETFVDQQPQFRGVASPGATVKIIIQSSQEIQTQVAADGKGVWSFRPTTPLAPGAHTISIVTQDRFGILKTVTQTFTVFAQGSQVTQSATPSASPTVTFTPTPTLTFTPTPTLRPSVTATPVPSASPTLIPTATPLPSSSPTQPPLNVSPTPPPVKPTIPASGSSSLFITGAGAVITTGIGILLFIISRGISL